MTVWDLGQVSGSQEWLPENLRFRSWCLRWRFLPLNCKRSSGDLSRTRVKGKHAREVSKQKALPVPGFRRSLCTKSKLLVCREKAQTTAIWNSGRTALWVTGQPPLKMPSPHCRAYGSSMEKGRGKPCLVLRWYSDLRPYKGHGCHYRNMAGGEKRYSRKELHQGKSANSTPCCS